MQIKRVIQPSAWGCLAACCAMLADVSMEETLEFFGHDGGSPHVNSPWPDGRRGFTLTDCAKMMAAHGRILGAGNQYPQGKMFHFPPPAIKIGNGPALVIVKTQASTVHAVVWDGKHILDPSAAAPEVAKLRDYRVLQWWPVGVIEGGA